MFLHYSYDKSIAKVSSTGKVTAVSAGTTYIYSIAPTGYYAKTKVKVKPLTVYLNLNNVLSYLPEMKDVLEDEVREVPDEADEVTDIIVPLTLTETTFEDLAEKHTEYTVDLQKYLGDGAGTLYISFGSDQIYSWRYVYDNLGNIFDKSNCYLKAYWGISPDENEPESDELVAVTVPTTISPEGDEAYSPFSVILPTGKITNGDTWYLMRDYDDAPR